MIDAFHDMRLKLLAPLGRFAMPDGYWENPASTAERPACHLTFDDGPFPETTPRLLELLEREGIKATFFFMGRNVLKYPHLAAMVARAGHEIGNHTHNHLPLLAMPGRVFESELDRTSELIFDAAGVRTRVFRPPFGIIDRGKALAVAERDMRLVYFGAVAEDWNPIGAREVARRIMAQIRPGSLVVLHESKHFASQCLDSTATIIERARERGLFFDTIVP
ncbi:MAG: polysaccharide deacetylase family protein [Candidatus Melainabacteria bacterium]|nr:polysaccharide deacetylase family protein [Candidatus Melainabacteria bacterium]